MAWCASHLVAVLLDILLGALEDVLAVFVLVRLNLHVVVDSGVLSFSVYKFTRAESFMQGGLVELEDVSQHCQHRQGLVQICETQKRVSIFRVKILGSRA